MKKTVVRCVLSVAVAVMASQSFAATAKSAREVLLDYSKQVKEYAFGKGGSSAALTEVSARQGQEKLINQLNLDAKTKSTLENALASEGTISREKLDALGTIVAAKKMAAEVSKSNESEGQSLSQAADAAVRILADSGLTGARKNVKGITAAELADVTAALKKVEILPEAILTRFQKAERDSFTEVLQMKSDLIQSGKVSSAEEAMIQAVMTVKNVDRAKALEIIRKLKDCV